MAAEAPWPPTVADVCRHGVQLVESLLACIDTADGGVVLSGTRQAHPSAHLLLWRHHMVSGAPGCGTLVIESLRAICRSPLVDHVGGGIYRSCAGDRHLEKTLNDNARFLELLTWVWRVCRCPALRRCAERIVDWAVAEMRVPGLGFAASLGAGGRDARVPADGNGAMLLSLVEAGSVFERREWLALAREVFDEIVGALADGGTLALDVSGGRRGSAAGVDDYAMMSRAAIRLFEAFGKRRYLDHAEAWVATLETAFREDGNGGYRSGIDDPAVAPSRRRSIADGALPSGNALMIGVLARLHALTGTPRYAERVEHLVETFRDDIMQSGVAGATAVANVQTAARLVSIEISGDPRLPETRELMRIALDCGLPDRLVLGPGAGGTPGESPSASIRVGACRLAPIGDAATLRTALAAGGLAAAHPRETVDSRSGSDIT